MAGYNAIILDASGRGSGVHHYVEDPGSYPAGEIPCTDAQAADPSAWRSDGNGGLVAAEPTSADVDAEFMRRLSLGTTVTLPGGTATCVAQTDEVSQGLVDRWVSRARYQIAQGNGTGATVFRDKSNTNHSMTWADVPAFADQIGAAVTLLLQKAWALKDTSPIPADYTADKHW